MISQGNGQYIRTETYGTICGGSTLHQETEAAHKKINPEKYFKSLTQGTIFNVQSYK